uniref:EF-hand domain (C-terminal) containing 2 n=1 Tax=Scleropages formosus TaxID=113540 RepID=A0A8D0CI14_SCLFO
MLHLGGGGGMLYKNWLRTLIHRHRIPLPSPDDDQFYTVYHFNLNQDVVLYSRTFRIADCDPFTRTFLQKLGVRLNPPDSVPEDPYSKLRKQPLRPYERWDTLKQFLEHDRNVLRFFCLWDDSENMSGDPRELVLHYFLADDTIEIREVVHPNSGRDAVPKFLHRSKLPKVRLEPTGWTLDMSGDSCVDTHDLMLGAVINVWGRKVLLCDCDDFTKRFYRTKYGVEDFTPVPRRPPPAPEPPRPVPPYNGFGSEEDSLCSCEGLLPKPPRRDFGKFMGLLSHVLRFVGRMVSDDPVNKERRFIISFYLSDDTISVFEPAQRNLGVLGGKFLERCRVRKPGQDVFKSEPSQYFQAWDLYVGARVCLHQHEFELLHADEYTLSYMERHAEEVRGITRDRQGPPFPVRLLLFSRTLHALFLKEMKRFFSTCDPGNMGVLPLESLRWGTSRKPLSGTLALKRDGQPVSHLATFVATQQYKWPHFNNIYVFLNYYYYCN